MEILYTPAGEDLLAHPDTIPWNDAYPRPQMVREDWLCLNGDWDFFDGHQMRSIRVPFCPESPLSGIGEALPYGEPLIYRKRFILPERWKGKRVLVHFGAVSRETTVYLNHKALCTHHNGYLPFSAELTDNLTEGENELTLRVIHDLSHKHPWGKQRADRGGMWYTPVTGIWQTVWLEPVPETYISSLSIQTGPDYVDLTVGGVDNGTARFMERDYPLQFGKVHIPVEDPILWSPENPHLYSFTVTAGEDRVDSYFALRTLAIREVGGVKRLCLNGKPYFFNAVLDQGYWSDGLYTPASPQCFEDDILAMKSLGFNTLRKHIKVEAERFYYDCDRLGMVVFQDMVNNGEYRYLRDTILPTIHLPRHKDDRISHRDRETRLNFLQAMDDTVTLLQNHPSICYWTIFNEGWGQFRADDAYRRLKTMDPTRFIDATSGWFHQKLSDVESLHIYFEKLHMGNRPLAQVMSEFGGWTYKVEGHSANLAKTYGYRKFTDRDSFVAALRGLYTDLLPLVRSGLSAAVYTQLSDVEEETNGFLTYDRKAKKVAPEELRDLMTALAQAVPQE